MSWGLEQNDGDMLHKVNNYKMEQSGILISLIRLMQPFERAEKTTRVEWNGRARRELRSRAKIMYDVMHLAPAKTPSIDPEPRSRILGDFLKIQQAWQSSLSFLVPSVQVDTTHCQYCHGR